MTKGDAIQLPEVVQVLVHLTLRQKMIHVDDTIFDNIIKGVAGIFILFYAILAVFFITSLVTSCYIFHKPDDVLNQENGIKGISIIKPLMGVDSLLEFNLESHFKLQYPKFELLFCVHNIGDPAKAVVEHLMQKYPSVDAKICIGGRDDIINPMVSNMVPAYEKAKYNVIWISSSRIKATTDIITDMVNKLHSPNTALVHQMPFVMDGDGVAAMIEKIHFGTWIPRTYIPLNLFGVNCVTGMSYVFRKDILDELGGLESYGKYLAEDFFISKAIHDKGFRHRVSAIPAQQNIATSTVIGYKDRMIRWYRLRVSMLTFSALILEPFSECFLSGISTAWAIHYFFYINPYIFFASHICIWIFLDYIQLKIVQNGPLPFSIFGFLLAWVLRELLAYWIYFESLLNHKVINWGKRSFKVKFGGETRCHVKSDTSTHV